MKLRLTADVHLMLPLLLLLMGTGMMMKQTVGSVVVKVDTHPQEYLYHQQQGKQQGDWYFHVQREREREEALTTTGTTPQAQCKWAPDPGPCHAFFRRYYYNWYTHSCETFVYGGCLGRVPFRTSQQCEAARCDLLESAARQFWIDQRNQAIIAEAHPSSSFHNFNINMT